MVRETYLQQLALLKESVLSLGELAEKILHDSMESVINLDLELARETLDLEPKADRLEYKIEVTINDLIALQQPLAGDLRLVVSALKISADLRRIVGLSINIAKIPGKIEGGHLKPLVDTRRMGDIAEEMLANSLKAFETRDPDLAKGTAALDDDVDKLFYSVWVELIEMMAKDPSIVSKATHLLFLIRYLERIADHCCNVCESVVYLSTAERIKLN
ncbi:phosphate signaling complex protein PhoU [Methanosarcina sp. Mfa9]|uniref:phosphate signaling complex protein PhoU n=1 Tax=Methanosarcina sp. Mfa9 TaxID=3439063 RepID=UPI003F86ADFE